MHEAEDGFLVSVEYEGSLVPTVYRTSWPNPMEMVEFQWDSWTSWKAGDPNWKSKFRGEFFQPLTRMSSLAEVQAADGDGYWQDSARNLVWILVRRTGLQTLGAEPYQTVHFVLSNRF